MKDKTN